MHIMMIESWDQLGSNLNSFPEKGGASAHVYQVECTLLWFRGKSQESLLVSYALSTYFLYSFY